MIDRSFRRETCKGDLAHTLQHVKPGHVFRKRHEFLAFGKSIQEYDMSNSGANRCTDRFIFYCQFYRRLTSFRSVYDLLADEFRKVGFGCRAESRQAAIPDDEPILTPMHQIARVVRDVVPSFSCACVRQV